MRPAITRRHDDALKALYTESGDSRGMLALIEVAYDLAARVIATERALRILESAAANQHPEPARAIILEKNLEIDRMIQERVGLIEQGREEARRGIAAEIDRRADDLRGASEQLARLPVDRARDARAAHVLRTAADVARNWKREEIK